MGVMLYYGDIEIDTDTENAFKKEFTKHCILALQTVQHKGNTIIKLKEVFSSFTAGLIFMMY